MIRMMGEFWVGSKYIHILYTMLIIMIVILIMIPIVDVPLEVSDVCDL